MHPLATWLGFGSVSADREEADAFLRRRVTLYVGFMLGLWLAADVAQILDDLLDNGLGLATSVSQPLMRVQLAVTALLIAVLLVVRRVRRSGWLHVADVGGTVLQGVALAFLLYFVQNEERPEMGITLGLTHLLIVRAAFVPSQPWRTALASAAAWLPIQISTMTLYAGPLAGRASKVAGNGANVLIWGVLAVGAATVVSVVVYGLRRSAAEARRLGQYRLVERLGEGGMGLVYRAEHAMLRRPTAVKLLPPERAGRGGLAHFEQEVQRTAALTHPNTIAVYDYGRTPDGLFYYAMEYLDGLDLESLVARSGPLPPGRVVHVLAQAAASLAEAHDLGLVHRDVKPANVMLCRRGRQVDFVKVLDFGLVRAAGESSAGAEPVGTPMCMSPEAITQPAEVDARSDVYALGCVAWHLLVGRPVFEADSAVAVCAHHLHTPVELPSRALGAPVPAALEALVLAMLEKDPAHRPADAGVVLERLAALDGIEPWTDDAARRWWQEVEPQLEQARTTHRGTPDRRFLTVAPRS